MSAYRSPAPPPADLARRMSWWERQWLHAWRRWVTRNRENRGALGRAMDRDEKRCSREGARVVTVVSVTKQDLLAGTRDLCHQKIVVDEGRPGDVRVLLDYQRYWTKVQMRAGRAFTDTVSSVERDALAFFEQIGAGELE